MLKSWDNFEVPYFFSKVNVIFSHQEFLDILPAGASKDKAIEFISNKWNIPLEIILVAGNSGNDEEMLVLENTLL